MVGVRQAVKDGLLHGLFPVVPVRGEEPFSVHPHEVFLGGRRRWGCTHAFVRTRQVAAAA